MPQIPAQKQTLRLKPQRAMKAYPWLSSRLRLLGFALAQASILYSFSRACQDDTFSISCYALAVGMGILACDVITGHVHFLLDHFKFLDGLARRTLGEPFVSQYEVHHGAGADICTYDFFETNSDGMFATTCLTALVLPLTLYLPGPEIGLLRCSLLAGFWAYCFFTAFSNQFHKWSHMSNPGAMVRALQKFGLAAPAHHHELHHREHMKALCVTVGWGNLLLDPIGYWPWLRQNISNLGKTWGWQLER